VYSIVNTPLLLLKTNRPHDRPAGKPVPQPLADRRSKGQLPKSFSTKKLLQEEGGTYGWLYKHVQRLQLWGHCGAVGKASGWVAPKGWELLDTPRISSDLRRCA
jgi:hypothetical protein